MKSISSPSKSHKPGPSGFTNTSYRDQVLGGLPPKKNKDQIEKETQPKTTSKAIR
jgi:hypothetical protein